MRSLLTFSAALAAAGLADADNYNTFTNSVKNIQYNNIGGTGTYQGVTDLSGGWPNTCSYESKEVSGSIAPFHEEVTFMVRAPIKFTEFAFYNRGNDYAVTDKRAVPDSRHGQAHQHLHNKAHKQKREWITASNAEWGVFSWETDVAAASTPAPAPAPAAASVGGGDEVSSVTASPASEFAPAASQAYVAPKSKVTGSSPEPDSTQSGGWTRQAYYNAATGQQTGLKFLTSQPLKPFTGDPSSLMTSDDSYGIWTDVPCSSDGGCGFVNPENTANYHGFSGTSKIFAFTFSMPPDASPPAGASYPDAPALWLLNSAIPLVQEFGCSCRASGCGEFDLFESIYDAQASDPDLRQKLTSTMYGLGPQSIGSQSYFERPQGASVKGVVVMDGGKATVALLPEGADVGALSQSVIEGVVGGGEKTVVRFPR